MSRLYQRVKGAFQRNLYSSRRPYFNSYSDSYNEERKYPSDQLDENDITEDVESVRNNNSSQKPTSRKQTKGRTRLDKGPPSTSSDLSNSDPRIVPNAIQPNLPSNTNVKINTVPISNPPARTQDPSSRPPVNSVPKTPLNGLPVVINPNQTLPPSIDQIPQLSVRSDFPSVIKRKRRPFQINPNSTLIDFPRRLNSQSSFSPQQNRPSFPPHFLPSSPQNNISNIEIDYPIENVFIDENIPSSIAIKINETVEYDRFGNAYYTHHYAYEPKIQHLTMGNNQQIERRLIEDSHHSGSRYIREIDYSQKQNLNNIQLIIDDAPQLNYFPVPVYHFTAHASSNDPMRCY